MAKLTTSSGHSRVFKRTSQGGKCKTSSMNKARAKTFKKYRGQGR